MKKHLKRLTAVGSVLLLVGLGANAQRESINEKLGRVATPRLNPGWFVFDKDVLVSAKTINAVLQQSNVLSSVEELRIESSETDQLGFMNTRFSQYYNGFPIAFAHFILHEKVGTAANGNGKLASISGNAKNAAPVISFEAALNAAKKKFPATEYAWENQQAEADLNRRTHGKMHYLPERKLVWLADDIYNLDSTRFTLAYRMTITGQQPSFTKEVFVSAADGSILKYFEKEYTCGTTTSFTSNFNGSRTAQYKYVTSQNGTTYNSYLMMDDCSWNTIYVSNNFNFYTPISNSTTAWPNTILINSAFTTQWAAATAMSYYNAVHSRHGFDGTGLFDIDARQNAGFTDVDGTIYYANASFNATGILKVGNNESAGPTGANSSAQDDWNSLDIIAHEFTHGVTANSSNLVYEKEPGALNESFSDIFGSTCYQYNSFLNTHIWEVGWDRTTTVAGVQQHTPIRNMANPGAFGHPSTYGIGAWVSTTAATDPGDKWGVHTNSGVQNLMYVLLVQGGAGTNAAGTAYNISGIGFAKARLIAYRTLTVYLGENSKYADARAAWIKSAEDLYGVCSVEAITTARAWQAVGLVGPFTANVNVCGTYGTTAATFVNNGAVTAGGTCITTINPSSSVQMKAGSIVYLKPGFTATSGSNFVANIAEGCGITSY